MTLHQNGAILTPSDVTTTVSSMNFLTFEDNYLAGQSPERKIIMTNKEKALALIGTFYQEIQQRQKNFWRLAIFSIT